MNKQDEIPVISEDGYAKNTEEIIKRIEKELQEVRKELGYYKD